MSDQLEPIFIVCATDNAYAQHCGVMLCSLIKEHRSREPLEIFILVTGLSNDNLVKFQEFKEAGRVDVHFIQLNPSDFKDLKISHYVSHATYYRLVIPKVIPQIVKKIVYLDCDLIFVDDIKKLWDCNISNYALAAIKDSDVEDRHLVDLNVSRGKYFNAGVMVINLEYWRLKDVSGQCMLYLNEHNDKVTLWDQDALNSVLHASWLELDGRWNTFLHLTREQEIKALSQDPKIYLENVSVMHFSGPNKPWHYISLDPTRSFYFNYLSNSPWKEATNPDKTFVKILMTNILRLLPGFSIRFLLQVYESIYLKPFNYLKNRTKSNR